MAIYNKTECQELAKRKARVLVKDQDPNTGEPIRVLRTVTKAFGSKFGRDSRWGVELDKPLNDGCTGCLYGFIDTVLP